MHSRVRALVAVTLLTLATAGAVAADPFGDWRAVLRAHLADPRFALDGRPEYVVTDAGVVEPALDYALARVAGIQPITS